VARAIAVRRRCTGESASNRVERLRLASAASRCQCPRRALGRRCRQHCCAAIQRDGRPSRARGLVQPLACAVEPALHRRRADVGPAGSSAQPQRRGSAASSAAAVGVGARRSAHTKSAMVKSVSWPTPLTSGTGLRRDRAGELLVVEGPQVLHRAAAAHQQDHVDRPSAASARMAACA
jgi:hypothetical protein